MGEKAIQQLQVTIIEPIATGGEGTVSLGKMNGKPVAVKVLKSLKEAEQRSTSSETYQGIKTWSAFSVTLTWTSDGVSSWNTATIDACIPVPCPASFLTFWWLHLGHERKAVGENLEGNLDGLSAIHASRTYHNDIKLENIMPLLL